MGLVGEHQHDNAVAAAGAALVLRQQGFERLGVPSILAGLSKARLPGRFQASRAVAEFRSLANHSLGALEQWSNATGVRQPCSCPQAENVPPS